MESEKIKLRKHYKKHAKTYDGLRDNKNIVSKRYSNLQIETVTNWFKDVKLIVEIGCGTGKFTIPLAKAGKKIIAIDASEEMLNILYSKAKQLNLTNNIDMNVGDIESLDFESETFDAVLSIALIRHLKNPIIPFKEISRIMKKNGIFVGDYLDKKYFWFYQILKNKIYLKGDEWFKNYYYYSKNFKDLLKSSNLKHIEERRFVSIPTKITSKFPDNFQNTFLSFEEYLNIGSVVYYKSVK